jgi:Fic family protein
MDSLLKGVQWTFSGTRDETSGREYERTHPWIQFALPIDRMPPQLWVDLGAVQSKVEHVANALLPPDKAKMLNELYLAKGVHGTTAIEGNTLSEEQVLQRIGHGKKLPESREYLGREIDNVVTACEIIVRRILRDNESEVTGDVIKQYNRMVLRGLDHEEGTVPGKYRQHSVGVGTYRGAPSQDCPYLTDRLCEWLKKIWPQDNRLRIGFAVLRAILAHLYLAWIHPFGDGNGRTARLVEFHILLAGGVPTIAAHLLSNFYNHTRTEYYRQLDRASKSGGNVLPFLQYAVAGLRDALDEQIQVIRQHQWNVAWRDYVYESFRGQKGEVTDRRRLIALALPQSDPCEIPMERVRHLTSEIAELYANKTAKTLMRDINALVKMNLVVQRGRKICANGTILTRFLPDRKNETGQHRPTPE